MPDRLGIVMKWLKIHGIQMISHENAPFFTPTSIPFIFSRNRHKGLCVLCLATLNAILFLNSFEMNMGCDKSLRWLKQHLLY